MVGQWLDGSLGLWLSIDVVTAQVEELTVEDSTTEGIIRCHQVQFWRRI